MAGIRYSTRFTSLNGQAFKLEVWDTDFGGSPSNNMAIGEGGVELSYDADGDKKFNDVCASTMKWTYVIKNSTDAAWIDSLIKVKEEKEVYAHLYQANSTGAYEYMWGGYILMDLSSTPDTSYPYDVELRAVDGLALLKEQRWMLPTATGFTEPDTYLPMNKQRFTYWFKEILSKAGAAEISNGAVKDYDFCTVNRWYNENHDANSILSDDPTYLTYCTTNGFYAQKENGEYEPDNAYNVLVGMLRSWGMRLVYYMGTYHFIQINEYVTIESGTVNLPTNMNTHYYDKAGVHVADREFIGDNQLGRYELEIDLNATQGLQKLEGTEYSYLPAIKNSIVEFESIEDVNYYQGYPDMFTSSDFSATAGTGNGSFKSKPLGIWTDAHTGAGWYFYLVMNLQGQVNTQNWEGFQYLWTIKAREVGTTPWTYMLHATGNTLSWQSYSSLWGAWSGMTISGLINGLFPMGGVPCQVAIPMGQAPNYNSDTLIFNSGTTTNGKIPEPSWSAVGQWEFELATAQVNRGAAQLQNGFNPTRRGWGNQSCGANSPLGLPTAFAKSVAANSELMSIEYADSLGTPNANGTINYNSVFSAIMSASNNVGYTMQSTYVSTTTTDSKTNIIKGVKYGDTTSPNAPGTLWVEDDVTGAIIATEPTGLWARNIAGGTDSFSELLAKQVIENQYHANSVLNGTIVLSSENAKFTGGALKNPNPICRIIDSDSQPYVMQRMVWRVCMDEWEGSWWAVINAHITTTTNTGGGGPVDDDDNSMGLANPGGNNGNGTVNAFRVSAPSGTQGKIGLFDGAVNPPRPSKRILTFTNARIIKGSVTSIPIANMIQGAGDDYAFLKTGMKLLIVDLNYLDVGALNVTEVTVAADQVLGDTTITIDAITITQDILANAVVELDIHQMAVSAFAESSGPYQNFSFIDCSITSITSDTSGEGNAVVLAYDTQQTPSPTNDITLYGSGGVGGLAGGEYSWSCDKVGYWQFSWNVTSNTSVQNNRVLAGVKLQSGVENGEAITWTDLEPSHSYIYDRGVGTLRKGSTSNQFILKQDSITQTTYYRLVLWKEASLHASTKVISVLKGTNLIIKEI